ncbi:MAG: ectoine hydroxylase EctD [Rhodobacteraceae bacterium HLUCCA12]|nr:MAG: ectoine hydroxylase EctD [Rhodobacteraceae bacterium HLUCCA12]
MTLHQPIRHESDVYPTRFADHEQIIDRVDPVLWSTWTETAPISREQAESYDKNGYLILRDAFSADEVRALIQSSADLRGGALDGNEDVVTEPGSGEVRTVFRLVQNSPAFDRLARDSRLAGVAQFLLGDDVYVHQSRLNYKPGFTGKEFYWHSDFETWHAEDGMPRMRAVSASLLLTDNDALNGPLMLMPGSQRRYIGCQGETPENNYRSSLKKQTIGTPSQKALRELAEAHGIDTATGPAGTLIFFDCNTMHGSNGNITPFPRSNAFFVFNAVSNALREPYAAPAPRPAHLAHRGAPKAIAPVTGSLA